MGLIACFFQSFASSVAMDPAYYVGSSGFSFRGWKGVFYPPELPPRKWFAYYCTQFNTLELNATFYRMPPMKSFETWYDQSPPDFCFAVKAPRQVRITKKSTLRPNPFWPIFTGLCARDCAKS
jgi:uncharacterized protein YecE (DUF72 family)